MSSDPPSQDFYQGTGSKDSGVGPVYIGGHASGEARVQYGNNYTTNNNIIQQSAQQDAKSSATELTPVKKFMERLKFNEMEHSYDDIKAEQDGTCSLLLDTTEWVDWQDSRKMSQHQGFFWIKGKAGSGKSTMMKFAARTAERQMPDQTILSYFFSAKGVAQLQKSVQGLYRVLLHQALEKLPHLQEIFQPRLLSHPEVRGGDDFRLEALRESFGFVVENRRNNALTCFIDALDECNETDVRDMITSFENLGRLAARAGDHFRVCFSSRHYPRITLLKDIELVLETHDEHQGDIVRYVDRHLHLQSPEASQIRLDLIRRASGVFLWVYLVIPILNKEHDRGRVVELKKRLDKIPGELEDLLDTIVHDTTHDSINLVPVLQWMLFTERVLRVQELYFAILSARPENNVAFWDSNKVSEPDMERFILDSSTGLVELVPDSRRIQLIHESVRQYLLGPRGLSTLQPDLSTNLAGLCQEYLKQACIHYILLFLVAEPKFVDHASRPLEFYLSSLTEYPFLGYAACFVFSHAEEAQRSGIPQDRFLYEPYLKELMQIDWWFGLPHWFDQSEGQIEVSKIKFFSVRGLDLLLELEAGQVDHAELECRVNCASALGAAALQGHAGRVGILLEKGVKPTWEDSGGDDGLDHAVFIGDINIFNAMLHYGATIGEDPVRDSRRVLCAARGGCDDILHALLKHGVDLTIGYVSKFAWRRRPETALYAASCSGHLRTVELLIKLGADVNCSGEENGIYYTPLVAAICNKNRGVVKSLLEHGAWLICQPLHAAVMTQDTETARLLIEHGADVNENHPVLGAPLHIASAQRDIADAMLFFSGNARTNSLAPDAPESGGSRYEIWSGLERKMHLRRSRNKSYRDMAQLLLQSGATPDSAHEDLGTPLHLASYYGRKTMAQLLLESGAAVNARSGLFDSALRAASIAGHEDIVEELLHYGADIDLIPQATARPHPASTVGLPGWAYTPGFSSNDTVIRGYPELHEAVSGTAMEAAHNLGHSEIAKMLHDHQKKRLSVE